MKRPAELTMVLAFALLFGTITIVSRGLLGAVTLADPGLGPALVVFVLEALVFGVGLMAVAAWAFAPKPRAHRALRVLLSLAIAHAALWLVVAAAVTWALWSPSSGRGAHGTADGLVAMLFSAVTIPRMLWSVIKLVGLVGCFIVHGRSYPPWLSSLRK